MSKQGNNASATLATNTKEAQQKPHQKELFVFDSSKVFAQGKQNVYLQQLFEWCDNI